MLSGCQSAPTLPDWSFEPAAVETTAPLPACTWPEISEGTLRSGESVFYLSEGRAGMAQQRACQETERANHDIAAGNAEALAHLEAAYNKVIEEGQAQRETAEFWLDDAESRRRDVVIELWTYKGLLALAAIAAIL